MNPLMMGLPGGAEWIILAVVALILFGGTKIAGFGKNAGRAIREFKEESRSISEAPSQQVINEPSRDPKPADEVLDAELVDPKPVVEQKPENQA
jgi:sec-independent protein translocase protein TatA